MQTNEVSMQRPASVVVLGVLNIAFGVLGIFGIIASVAVLQMVDDGHNPILKLIHEKPMYAAWFKVMIPLGIFNSLILLACGIGLLMMQNWARILTIIYAIWALLIAVVNTIVNVVFLWMPLIDRSSQNSPAELAGAIGAAVGAVFGIVIAVAFPVVQLILMTRPKVVQAFHQKSAATSPLSYPPSV